MKAGNLPQKQAEPAASITSRVVRGAQWMVAWRIVSRALGFVSVLLLANLLTPADFGVVAIATAVSAAVEGLSQLGVRDALVRLKEDHSDYFNTAFTIQAGRGLVTGGLVAASAGYAAEVMAEPRITGILWVLAGTTVVSGFENIGVVRFNRALEFRVLFLLQAAPRLLGFMVTTLLAFLLHSYWALVVGGAIAKLGGVAASYVMSPHRPRFGTAGWRYLVHFSFWTWMGGLVLVVLQRADPFLLGPVLGTGVFGLYVLAGEIAALPVTELLEPASAALFPGLALARRGGTNPATMGLSIAGALALFTVPFSIGISACSGYLVVALLGPKWDAAQPLIAIMAWSCVFLPFSWVTVVALSAQGHVKQVVASHAIAAGLKVAGVLAVRNTGNLRIIALTMVGVIGLESLMFIWQLWSAGNRELRGLALTALRALPSIAITLLMLSVMTGAWAVVGLPRVQALLVGGLIGGLTFAVFLVCQASFWVLAGKPRGAESRIADALTSDPQLGRMIRAARHAVGRG